ncbi:glycosyltransferase family protein, partial [Staphylococcus aureus]
MRFVEAGLPIDVYGLNWDRHLAPSPLLRLNGFVSGDDLLRTLRRYRVQLNVFRPHNGGSHNMRSFEVPAA